MLTLGPGSPADVAMDQVARLATTAGVTPPQVVGVIVDALEAWRGMPDGRQHAMQLRSLLSAELAGAIERADRLKLAERQQAQAVGELLRAGMVTLGARLARW